MISFLAIKGYLPRLNLESPLPINKGLKNLVKKEMKLADIIMKKIEVLKIYLRDELIWS